MNIVILGTAHPLRGGLAAFNERLARGLQAQGHTVELYTFSLQYPNFLFPGATQYASEPPPSDLTIRVVVNSINPFNWLTIGRELRRKRPDLIICGFWLPFMAPCFGTILRLAKQNGHTRVMGIIHNIIPHERRVGDKQLSRYFTACVDAFVSLSRSVADELKAFTTPDRPITYLAHPIYDLYGDELPKNTAKQLLQIAEGDRIVLFFGIIRDYKGLDLLLEAFAIAAPQLPALKLLIAGEFYSGEAAYRKQIHDLGIADKVLLHTHFIPNDEVRRYFSAADLVAQPYKHATQSGISQICYHFAKPMLVTEVGGLPEIVPNGKAGYVVPPNPAAIADAMVRFYTENREEELREGVRSLRHLYTWEYFIEQSLQMIKW